jgi:hypothetical protein
MFENLIKDTAFPTLIGLIDQIDKSLIGVRERLNDQSLGSDHITALTAKAQIDALNAWEPMLWEIKAYLDSQITHHAAPHVPPPGGHRS